MVYISEWLPNPAGNDTAGEWVELWNNGAAAADLTDWRLTADGKKFFALKGVLPAHAGAVLPRSDTKLTLKNSDGKLALYDASGRLADQVAFQGSAPEGESANRTQTGFFFGKPTPGKANAHATTSAIVFDNEYPFNTPLGPTPGGVVQFSGFLLVTALALSAVLMFILKSHEDLSDIFFRGN